MPSRRVKYDRAMNRIACLGLACLLSGCAVGLTQAGSHVKLMKSDPPTGCVEIGTVEAARPDTDSEKNEMRNEAANMNANFVRWDTVSDQTGSTGTAFKCDPSLLGAPQHARTH